MRDEDLAAAQDAVKQISPETLRAAQAAADAALEAIRNTDTIRQQLDGISKALGESQLESIRSTIGSLSEAQASLIKTQLGRSQMQVIQAINESQTSAMREALAQFDRGYRSELLHQINSIRREMASAQRVAISGLGTSSSSTSEIAGLASLEVKSGSAKILYSGLAMAFNENPIELSFGAPSSRLNLSFSFSTEPPIDESRVNVSNNGEGSIAFKLINFNNPLGTGTIEPLELGTLGKMKLFMHYRVYDLVGEKTFMYTIYVKEGE